MTRSKKPDNILGTRWGDALLSAGAVLIYALVFLALFPFVGSTLVSISLIPVTLMGWLFGMWGGMITGFLLIPLNAVLLAVAGESGWMIMLKRGLSGSILSVMVGGIIGRLRDLRARANQELSQRLEIATELRIARDELERHVQERTLELKSANENLRSEVEQRQKSEAELQESQRWLSSLMGNLPGMVYRCKNDRNWTMAFVSEGSIKLTGYQPEDLQHNKRISYSQIIHPDDRQAVWNEVQRALEQDRRFQITYRIFTAEGEQK